MTVDPLEMFKSQAKELVKNTLSRMGINTELPLEIPPEEMGDYAFPCFLLAKEMKKSPVEIAKLLCQEIPDDLTFSKRLANGPYINFYINPEMLVQITIESIMEMREDYGTWPNTGININLSIPVQILTVRSMLAGPEIRFSGIQLLGY